VFADLNYAQIKNKFKKEQKENPDLLQYAQTHSLPVGMPVPC